MDIKELRAKSLEELARVRDEVYGQIHHHSLQLATRQSTQTSLLKGLKRTLARIETLLTQSRHTK